MTIYHSHHIIPKHMGGTDDPTNLVLVTVEQHAELHKQLWEDLRYDEDRLAWLGLSKMIGREQHLYEMSVLAGNKSVLMGVGIHDPLKRHLKVKGGKISIKKIQKMICNSRWMNNGTKDTRVRRNEVDQRLADGWTLGRLFSPNKNKKNLTNNVYWINKAGKNKRIPRDQIDIYIKDGWSPGMIMKD